MKLELDQPKKKKLHKNNCIYYKLKIHDDYDDYDDLYLAL